jgi:hypothetical protein
MRPLLLDQTQSRAQLARWLLPEQGKEEPRHAFGDKQGAAAGSRRPPVSEAELAIGGATGCPLSELSLIAVGA